MLDQEKINARPLPDLSFLGQAAVKYVRSGYAVYPCNPLGKTRLVEDSLTTESEVIGAWIEWPLANVGLATDEVWALDLDLTDVSSLNGDLRKVVFDLLQVPGPVISTGRGYHKLFRQTSTDAYGAFDTDLQTCIRLDGQPVDVIGMGWHVVAPPSIHESGKLYAFVEEQAPIEVPVELYDALNGLIERSSTDLAQREEYMHRRVADYSDVGSKIKKKDDGPAIAPRDVRYAAVMKYNDRKQADVLLYDL